MEEGLIGLPPSLNCYWQLMVVTGGKVILFSSIVAEAAQVPVDPPTPGHGSGGAAWEEGQQKWGRGRAGDGVVDHNTHYKHVNLPNVIKPRDNRAREIT